MSSVASSLSMMRRGSAKTDITLTSVAENFAIAIDEIGPRRRHCLGGFAPHRMLLGLQAEKGEAADEKRRKAR